ncbi:polysaccharide biosynthesis related protein [Sulfurovum sp. TSL6]|uniref:flippase n=1 Tax=Sulfurovum sp. TSL6 TaxID=2826995 RepID=UPI001CC7BFBB|nr:flippase [Sulfurovum sp. TSL6]GIU00843.1 polysaccharide biosynthesis related protein [Sulfurovum sp. TSL6]
MIRKIKTKLEEDSHLSDLISSSIMSFGLRIMGIVVGYLFILLISRNLGASSVGIFTLAFTVLQIASIFGRFGLDTALLRFVSESAAHGKMGEAAGSYGKAMVLAFFLALSISIAVYLSAETIAAGVFSNLELTRSFEIASTGVVPMTLTYLNFETMRAMKKIREYAFFQNVSTFLVATVLLFFMLDTDSDPAVSIVVFVTAAYVTWLLSQYKVMKLFRFKLTMQGREIFSMLKVSFPMMVASSLMLIMGWTDTIMIGMFIDESSVGVYSVALKVATVTSITLMAINSMSAPKFAEFYAKNDMASLQYVVSHSSRLIFWTSLPILIVSIVFPEQILSIFGEEFKLASWALIILCIGQFVNVVSGSVGYILQMTGKEKVFQHIILLSIVLNIALNYWLIPLYGIEGAAVASAFSLGTWNLLSVYVVRYKVKITTIYLPYKLERGIYEK